MPVMRKEEKSVSAYMKSMEKETRTSLTSLRSELKRLIPDGEEVLRYGIPTLRLYGKNLIHYAGYKTHIGLYPGPKAIATFAKELSRYKTSKGAVRIPLGDTISRTLLQKIVQFCIKEHKKHFPQ